MPFKSEAQRRFMYARHPKVAERWRREYGPQRELPKKLGKQPPWVTMATAEKSERKRR